MKRKFFVVMTFLAFIAFASTVWAVTDAVVTQQLVDVGKSTRLLIFTCTADSSDGSIPDTDVEATYLKDIQGTYLMDVIVFPTPGGVAPDEADITLKTKTIPTRSSTLTPAVPRDLLAGAGVSLIHATDEQHLGAVLNGELISGNLTLGVTNQGTNSAEYTIILKFYVF
jgi:hypothetical protein